MNQSLSNSKSHADSYALCNIFFKCHLLTLKNVLVICTIDLTILLYPSNNVFKFRKNRRWAAVNLIFLIQVFKEDDIFIFQFFK